MARNDPQVNFRIPAELNDRLKEAAAANSRTLTAELVSRLEASFEVDRPVAVSLQLQGALGLAQATLDVLQKARAQLLQQKKAGTYAPVGDQAADVDEEIAKGDRAIAFFEHDIDMQMSLLREIAERRASGSPMSASEIRQRVREINLTIF